MEQTALSPVILGPLVLGLTVGLMALNLATFTAFAVDKQREMAGREPLPEVLLLSLAALGGWPAAKFAQAVLRFTEQTTQFRSLLNLVALPLAAIGALVVYETVDLAALGARTMAYVEEVTETGPGHAAKQNAAAKADGTAEPTRFGPASDGQVGKRLTVPVKQ